MSLTQNIASLSSTLAKKSASPAEAFEVFSEPFQKCTILEEYKSHRLDEVLVAAIAPIVSAASPCVWGLGERSNSFLTLLESFLRHLDENGLEELGCAR